MALSRALTWFWPSRHPLASKKGRAPTSGTRKGNGAGRGGQAKGPGYGGPANGALVWGPASGTAPDIRAWNARTAEERRAHKERREDWTIDLEQHVYGLALGAEHEETQLRASLALHAIINGTPVSRTLNANTDPAGLMSNDELAAEISRLENEAASLEAASGEAGSSGAEAE